MMWNLMYSDLYEPCTRENTQKYTCSVQIKVKYTKSVPNFYI